MNETSTNRTDLRSLNVDDIEDLQGLKLKDVAGGRNSTGFVFEREDGSLTGFQVPLPMERIAATDFEAIDDSEMTEVELE